MNEVSVTGYNRTQGFSQSFFGSSSVSGNYHYLSYTLPDDGCTWDVIVTAHTAYDANESGTVLGASSYSFTVTTPGSFTGYSPRTATDAANAANNNAYTAAQNATAAKNSADAANTAATNAANAANAANTDTNYIRNNILSESGGIIQDSSGTVLSAVRAAKTSADTAVTQTTFGGKTAAEWASIAAQKSSPPQIDSIKGLNNATCTETSQFTVVITATGDDIQYRVTLDDFDFDSGYTSNNTITITEISSLGAHTAKVYVKNEAELTVEGSITFFRL